MPGEVDLTAMLATLEVERRAQTYTFVTGDWPQLAPAAAACIDEVEGRTWVVPVDAADAAGAPVTFRAAWLTLTVHSALEAVGLTAAFSRVLGEAGIPCNVLAGYYHDHLLVPVERADDAIAALEALAARSDRSE